MQNLKLYYARCPHGTGSPLWGLVVEHLLRSMLQRFVSGLILAIIRSEVEQNSVDPSVCGAISEPVSRVDPEEPTDKPMGHSVTRRNEMEL